MKEDERQRIEQRLLEERERAVHALEHLDEVAQSSDEDGDLTLYPLHLADEGTDTMEQEKGLQLLSKESERLAQIDEALRRLYRAPDRFGACTRCGRSLALERLDMVPWAALCLDCQTAEEGMAAPG